MNPRKAPHNQPEHSPTLPHSPTRPVHPILPDTENTVLGSRRRQSSRETVHTPINTNASTTSERYQTLEELGRGGMGVVMRVRDRRLHRDVAMKVAHSQSADASDASPERTARFMEEAQITGQLEHPNIVPIHDLGQGTEGRLYFTMKLVRGQSLKSIIEKTREQRRKRGAEWPIAERVEIVRKIADALAFAHSRQVLHRDLKPDNVMVGEFGEVLVMDWGLAKLLGTPSTHTVPATVVTDRRLHNLAQTQDGQVAGTPTYMSPEQARGDIDQLDQRSDVYALGATLYELLALAPPFTGTVAQVLWAVVNHRLERPTVKAKRELGANATPIPAELEAIALKAMAFDPARRYPTITEFKRDLDAFIANGTVSAMRYGLATRLSKWVRRHPTLALGTMLSTVFALAVGLIISMLLGEQQRLQRVASESATAEREAQYRLWLQNDELDKLRDQLGVALAYKRSALIEKFIAFYERQYLTHHHHQDVMAAIDPTERQQFIDAFLDVFKASDKHGRVYYTAEDYYYLGILHSTTDPHAAIRYYTEALKLRPRLAGAYLNRGYARRELGQLDDALADFNHVLSHEPNNPSGLCGRGSIFYSQDELEKSKADYDRALSLAPDMSEARLGRAMTLLKLRQYVAAIEDANQVLAVMPKDVDALNIRGQANLFLENFLAAADDLTHVIKTHPKNVESRVNRASAYLNLGRYSEAEQDTNAALDLVPAHFEALVNRAMARLLRKNTSGAMTDIDAALKQKPNSASAHTVRGQILEQRGDKSGAESEYDAALRLEPTMLLALFNRAQLRIDRNHVEGAVEDLNAFLTLRPNHGGARNRRGAMHMRLNQYEQALNDFTAVVTLEPKWSHGWGNRAAAAYALKRYNDAIANYQEALKLAPQDWQFWMYLGNSLSYVGRNPEAMIAFQEALKFVPATETAKRQQLEEAIKKLSNER